MNSYLQKRGNHFHYIRRIPLDLQARFPSAIVSRSLKTTHKKRAQQLAAAYEYKAQELFVHLRSGMLDESTEKLLIALFLKQGLEDLDLLAMGKSTKLAEERHAIGEDAVNSIAVRRGLTSTDDKNAIREDLTKRWLNIDRRMLLEQDTAIYDGTVSKLVSKYKRQYGITITKEQQRHIALQLINNDRKVDEAAVLIHSGDWSKYDQLKLENEAALAKPHFMLDDVVTKYKKWWYGERTNPSKGTCDDMETECRVLIEILGNISITSANTLESLTRLKSVLKKYPLNKTKKYGDKSIHQIVKSNATYEVIKPKTANEYLKRLNAIIIFANKAKMLQELSVVTYFSIAENAEDQRDPYDAADIARLIDAICTKPLWFQKSEKRPERFWIVLIAVFHGFRLGNIVELQKSNICETDKGIWVFDLRRGKTKATIRPVAICDTLILLGFLDWVNSLDRDKLFNDTSKQFSDWYNRNEKRGKYVMKGFESRYVTEDSKKCLYSIRHSYAGNVFELTDDIKITADLMGQSTGRNVTARYTKRTRVEKLQNIQNELMNDGVYLNQLDSRVKELFGELG